MAHQNQITDLINLRDIGDDYFVHNFVGKFPAEKDVQMKENAVNSPIRHQSGKSPSFTVTDSPMKEWFSSPLSSIAATGSPLLIHSGDNLGDRKETPFDSPVMKAPVKATRKQPPKSMLKAPKTLHSSKKRASCKTVKSTKKTTTSKTKEVVADAEFEHSKRNLKRLLEDPDSKTTCFRRNTVVGISNRSCREKSTDERGSKKRKTCDINEKEKAKKVKKSSTSGQRPIQTKHPKKKKSKTECKTDPEKLYTIKTTHSGNLAPKKVVSNKKKAIKVKSDKSSMETAGEGSEQAFHFSPLNMEKLMKEPRFAATTRRSTLEGLPRTYRMQQAAKKVQPTPNKSKPTGFSAKMTEKSLKEILNNGRAAKATRRTTLEGLPSKNIPPESIPSTVSDLLKRNKKQLKKDQAAATLAKTCAPSKKPSRGKGHRVSSVKEEEFKASAESLQAILKNPSVFNCRRNTFDTTGNPLRNLFSKGGGTAGTPKKKSGDKASKKPRKRKVNKFNEERRAELLSSKPITAALETRRSTLASLPKRAKKEDNKDKPPSVGDDSMPNGKEETFKHEVQKTPEFKKRRVAQTTVKKQRKKASFVLEHAKSEATLIFEKLLDKALEQGSTGGIGETDSVGAVKHSPVKSDGVEGRIEEEHSHTECTEVNKETKASQKPVYVWNF